MLLFFGNIEEVALLVYVESFAILWRQIFNK
jgi:hypothetical protein